MTPVREALTYLESIGLVEEVNYKNICVTKFLCDEVEEIYYMRSALCGLAAKNTTKQITEEDKKALEQIVKSKELEINIQNQENFHSTNTEFHQLISQYIKTPLLRKLDQELYAITRRHQIFGAKVRSCIELVQEHRIICNAVCNGDSEKAEYFGSYHYSSNIKCMKEFDKSTERKSAT